MHFFWLLWVGSGDTIKVETLSALGGEALRNHWIKHAQELDQEGRFAKYPHKQRAQILKKGFLGQWPPDRALAIARQQVKEGYAHRTAKFNDEMRDHFGLVGEDVREALMRILEEIPPDSYDPPAELEEPPGCPFLFRCKTLGAEVYFKLQVRGTAKKPQVLLWSCHPPIF